MRPSVDMKNYIRYAFGLALLVVLMTVGLNYIPENAVRAVGLKPVDILADLNEGNTVANLDQLVGETEAGRRPEGGEYVARSVSEPDTVASAEGDSTRAVSTIFVEPEPEPEELPPPQAARDNVIAVASKAARIFFIFILLLC